MINDRRFRIYCGETNAVRATTRSGGISHKHVRAGGKKRKSQYKLLVTTEKIDKWAMGGRDDG